jgi:creatinine amidohydrolase
MVDGAAANDVAEAVAKELELLVCPPLWFGWSQHHMGYAGSITLGGHTFVSVIEDICDSLIYHGFKKLILINGNRTGNLAPMEMASIRIVNRTGAYVAIVDTGQIAREEVGRICQVLGHAGESETSLMLATHPELVDMSQAVDPTGPAREEERFNYHYVVNDFRRVTYNNVSARPSWEAHKKAAGPVGTRANPLAATPEKGKAMLDAIVANTVRFIRSIADKPVEIKARNLPL